MEVVLFVHITPIDAEISHNINQDLIETKMKQYADAEMNKKISKEQLSNVKVDVLTLEIEQKDLLIEKLMKENEELRKENSELIDSVKYQKYIAAGTF